MYVKSWIVLFGMSYADLSLTVCYDVTVIKYRSLVYLLILIIRKTRNFMRP